MGIVSSFLGQSFFIPTPPLTEKNLPDQSGKVFIITGGYAGVGTELSKILYSHNATVYIAGRSETKATKTINEIKQAVPTSNGKLAFLSIDLSDLTTIKSAAEKFMSQETKLHWLNNNAGVMVPPKGSKGAQDMDVTYQTNILGPFLFTKLLLPVLKKTAESEPESSVRVSWAGSLAVDLQSPAGGVEFTENDEMLKHGLLDPQTSYGTSKAANFLLAHEFARRYPNDGVLHNSYNPGNLRTELQRHMATAYPRFAVYIINNLLCFDAIFGAYTELYCGLSPDLTIPKDQGVFIVPWGRKYPVRKDIQAEVDKADGGKAARLWEWCNKVTGRYA